MSIVPAADVELSRLKADLEHEHARLKALQDIGQALGSTLDLDELMELMLVRIANVMDAERAALFVADDASGQLWSRVTHGGQTLEIRLRPGQGLAGWVAKAGKPLNVKDAYQDVRFDAEWDRRTGFHTSSALCMPVKNHQGRTIAVLQALNRRRGYFTLDDEAMLSALASQVAVTIENSKLFLSVVSKNMELLEAQAQLEQKVRELDVLFEIAQVAASAIRLDDLLEGMLARAMHAIDAEAGSILLADETTGDLRFRCALGGVPDAITRFTIKADEGICGWVARHGTPQLVNDVSTDPRHSVNIAHQVGYFPRSVLCVPLMLDGNTGALELLNKSQGRGQFSGDDLKLASVIASHIATAITRAQTRERQEREQRLSTIGQLLSGVLHDLRGPMTVIKGYARFLKDETDTDKREAYDAAIQRQVESVNAMTTELLAFVRGEKNLLLRKVYLKSFFEELADTLRVELEGKHITLGLSLEDRGVAHLDESKIRRAVHNLVRNAAQALAAQGGGHVEIGVRRRAEDGALMIACSDNGPGVADEIRNRIFDSFTTHGSHDGTGLGLAIVQKVAEDHGGTITMNSRPGETVFTLVVPQPGVKPAQSALGIRPPEQEPIL